LAALAAFVVLVGVVIYYVPLPIWWRSYILGVWTVLGVGAIALVVYVGAGSHGYQLGKMGEESTARALLGWRRRRRGWTLINGLYFSGHGDVDHVLVGPGGVFVLESKWISELCQVTDGGVTGLRGRDPIKQVRTGANKIESLLRYGHERHATAVQPVVVLWGPGSPKIEGGCRYVGGTLVCEGRRQRSWLKELNTQELDLTERENVIRILATQRDRQLPDPSRRPTSAIAPGAR